MHGEYHAASGRDNWGSGRRAEHAHVYKLLRRGCPSFVLPTQITQTHNITMPSEPVASNPGQSNPETHCTSTLLDPSYLLLTSP